MKKIKVPAGMIDAVNDESRVAYEMTDQALLEIVEAVLRHR